MQSHLFARTAWWSTAALFLLLPGLATAGPPERPARGFCPYGLAQWMARQSCFVQADDGCPYDGRPCRDYSQVEDAERPVEAGDADITQDVAEAVNDDLGLAPLDMLADPRHGMGERYVLRLNILNDGLDDELDAEMEWSDPFLPEPIAPLETEVEVSEEAMSGAAADERPEEGCEVEKNVPEMEDENPREDGDGGGDGNDADGEDAGFLSALGRRIRLAVEETVGQVVDAFHRVAANAAAEEVEDASAEPAPRDLEPHECLPAVGSPWDADSIH